MVQQALDGQHLTFCYVWSDSWFSASDNMFFIDKLEKYFVMDVKINKMRMFSTEDRDKGQWTKIDQLSLPPEQPVKVWIKALAIEVVLFKFVLTNKGVSTGEMYLVSNDFCLSAESFQTLYKKRWRVEGYRQSLKQNVSLAKSPTRKVRTQTAHLLASLPADVKLEKLKFAHKLNHFASKAKMYLVALKMAGNNWKTSKIIIKCVK